MKLNEEASEAEIAALLPFMEAAIVKAIARQSETCPDCGMVLVTTEEGCGSCLLLPPFDP